MNFNVTKETTGNSLVPIPVPVVIPQHTPDPLYPNGYKFPVGRLVSVSHDPAKKTKREEGEIELPVLIFHFVDKDKRVYSHIIYPIDNDDADEASKEQDRYNQIIKHIWDNTLGEKAMPEEGLAPGATDFPSFFAGVAKSFNSVTREEAVSGNEKPKLVKKFADVEVYMKLTYYKNRLGFPRYPNFLQVAQAKGTAARPCIALTIDHKYDKLVAAGADRDNISGSQPQQFGGTNEIYETFPDL